jgi:hypothetical protein
MDNAQIPFGREAAQPLVGREAAAPEIRGEREERACEQKSGSGPGSGELDDGGCGCAGVGFMDKKIMNRE